MQIQINDSSEKSTSRLSACICNGRVYQAPWWIRGLKVHITKPASWAGDRLGSICSEQSHLSSCNHPIHRVEWQTPPSHLSCWQTSHPVLRLSTVGDMPVFVRYLHFMILHRYPVWFLMWCLSAWQMKWVVTSGPLMNQGVTGWQMVSRVSHNTPPYPIPNRRTKLPLSRSLNLPLSTTASVALISFPNYQRTSRMLLPEKCVPFLIFCF